MWNLKLDLEYQVCIHWTTLSPNTERAPSFNQHRAQKQIVEHVRNHQPSGHVLLWLGSGEVGQLLPSAVLGNDVIFRLQRVSKRCCPLHSQQLSQSGRARQLGPAPSYGGWKRFKEEVQLRSLQAERRERKEKRKEAGKVTAGKTWASQEREVEDRRKETSRKKVSGIGEKEEKQRRKRKPWGLISSKKYVIINSCICLTKGICLLVQLLTIKGDETHSRPMKNIQPDPPKGIGQKEC